MKKFSSFLETYFEDYHRIYYKTKHIGFYDTEANYKFNLLYHNFRFTESEIKSINKNFKKLNITHKIDHKCINFTFNGITIELLKDSVFYAELQNKNIKMYIRLRTNSLKDIYELLNTDFFISVINSPYIRESIGDIHDTVAFELQRKRTNIMMYYSLNTEVKALVDEYVMGSNTNVTVDVETVLKTLSDEVINGLDEEIAKIIDFSEFRTSDYVYHKIGYNEISSGSFKTFLKVLRYASDKNLINTTFLDGNEQNLIHLSTPPIETNDFINALARFKTLDYVLSKIDYDKDESIIGYISIDVNLNINYGFIKDGTENISIGIFPLTKSLHNFLKTYEFSFLTELKNIFIKNSYEALKCFSIIYNLINTKPIDTETNIQNVSIDSDILNIYLNDYGSWNRGVINDTDYIALKTHYSELLKSSKRKLILDAKFNLLCKNYKCILRFKP
jgi:hypothetical protein